MRAVLKLRIFRQWGYKCAVCGGDPDCRVNKGHPTDLHEEYVTKGTISGWPEHKKELINHEMNCAPVCRGVNTADNPYSQWHDRVRRAHQLHIGRRELGETASDEEAIAHAQGLIAEWVQTLGLKLPVRLTFNEIRDQGGSQEASKDN